MKKLVPELMKNSRGENVKRFSKGNHKWGLSFLIYVGLVGAEKEERTVLQIEPSLASHNKYKKNL